MKNLLTLVLFLASAHGWASSHYLTSRGDGWAYGEHFACDDAKRDAERRLQSDCRRYGRDHELDWINYSPFNCWCREDSFRENYFSCDVNASSWCREKTGI